MTAGPSTPPPQQPTLFAVVPRAAHATYNPHYVRVLCVSVVHHGVVHLVWRRGPMCAGIGLVAVTTIAVRTY